MGFLKYLMLMNTIGTQLTQALADNELTVKEIEQLIDTTMKQTLGYGLDDIAIQIREVNGKKEIKFIIKES